MKFLLWAVVLASPWETGWLPVARNQIEVQGIQSPRHYQYQNEHGSQRWGADRLGLPGGAGRSPRSIAIWSMGAVADGGGGVPPTVDTHPHDLAADQDPLAGFIEHRELRLRDERIAANVCVDDGEQDLCATSIPEIHRWEQHRFYVLYPF